MAKRLTIPLGAMPDDKIKAGVLAVTERLQRELRKHVGSDFRITTEHVNTQHEVLRDEVTVALKHVEYQVDLRRGLTAGAKIRVAWNWDKKEEVSVSVASASKLESLMFWGAMVAALLVAGVIIFVSNTVSYGRNIAGPACFVLFLVLFVVFLIPYPFVRVFLGVRNNALIEEVSRTVSTLLSTNSPG